MDLVDDSAYVKEGVRYQQKSEKCPPNSTLGWGNSVKFIITCIVCQSAFHILHYDVGEVYNFGVMYLITATVSMILVAWPVTYLEMALAQKTEGNMLNSLGQMHKALWTMSACAAFLNSVNFLGTHLQIADILPLALTTYVDWRGDANMPALAEQFQRTGLIPVQLGENLASSVCCSSFPNMTDRDYNKRYECLINETHRLSLKKLYGPYMTLDHFYNLSAKQKYQVASDLLIIDEIRIETPYFIGFIISILWVSSIAGWRYDVLDMLSHQTAILSMFGVGALIFAIVDLADKVGLVFNLGHSPHPYFLELHEKGGGLGTLDWCLRAFAFPILSSLVSAGCFTGENYFLASHMPVRSNTAVNSLIVTLGRAGMRLLYLFYIYAVQYNRIAQKVDSYENRSARIMNVDSQFIKVLFSLCVIDQGDYNRANNNPPWVTSFSIGMGGLLLLALTGQVLRAIVIVDMICNSFAKRRNFRKVLTIFQLCLLLPVILASNLYWTVIHILMSCSLLVTGLLGCFILICFFALVNYSKIIFNICVCRGRPLANVEKYLLFMSKWIITICLLPVCTVYVYFIMSETNIDILYETLPQIMLVIIGAGIISFLFPILFLLIVIGVGKESFYGKAPFEMEYYAAPLIGKKHQKSVQRLFGTTESILLEVEREKTRAGKALLQQDVFMEGDEDVYVLNRGGTAGPTLGDPAARRSTLGERTADGESKSASQSSKSRAKMNGDDLEQANKKLLKPKEGATGPTPGQEPKDEGSTYDNVYQPDISMGSEKSD